MAQFQHNWQSQLHRSIHRQIGVGDHLKPGKRFPLDILRPAHSEPCIFHLRQAGNLGYAAHGEREGAGIRDKTLLRRAQRKVEKHFIGNDGHLVGRTNLVEVRGFFRLGEMSGRIIGMDDNHTPSARRDGLL